MTRLLPLVAFLAACGTRAPEAPPRASGTLADDSLGRAERLEQLLAALADDSMMGRRIGSPENAKAARFLAAELQRYGVEPAGDDGFLQAVPLARMTRDGRSRFVIPSADVDFDTVPPDAIRQGESNVVGLIRGSDPARAGEAVVIGAHFDHVGVGRAVDGDSIYNGADDDGSGTVAVLEIARALARGPAPARTIVVLLSTGEEAGLLGTRWYMEHPVVPLDSTVADFQIEMIGRPDSLAGGFGRAWLTGYERTTMGDELARAGSPIVPDPRPDQRFFFRSDNVPFALAGIPAHTLSSYNLHADYHQPDDEVDRIDFGHMAAVVDAAVTAVRFLADGPRPEWKPGGRDDFPQRGR